MPAVLYQVHIHIEVCPCAITCIIYTSCMQVVSCVLPRVYVPVRNKSSLTEEERERLANGPGFEDFVSGFAPQTPDHLVRKKGQRY